MIGTSVRSARLADLPGLAAVLQESFSSKMRVIFSKNPEKVQTLLEAAYTGPVQRGYDGVIVAERDDRIIGTLLIQPVYYTQRESRLFEHTATQELGMFRMLWAAFLLWLTGYTPNADEAHISDLAVAQDFQGQGVGQMLLEQAELWAQAHKRLRMSLWVAENNEQAIHLYEKMGYKTTRTRLNLFTKLTFGVHRWLYMEKPVPDVTPELPKLEEALSDI